MFVIYALWGGGGSHPYLNDCKTFCYLPINWAEGNSHPKHWIKPSDQVISKTQQSQLVVLHSSSEDMAWESNFQDCFSEPLGEEWQVIHAVDGLSTGTLPMLATINNSQWHVYWLLGFVDMWLCVLSSVVRKYLTQLAPYPFLRPWEMWDGAADSSALSDTTQSFKICIKYGKGNFTAWS